MTTIATINQSTTVAERGGNHQAGMQGPVGALVGADDGRSATKSPTQTQIGTLLVGFAVVGAGVGFAVVGVKVVGAAVLVGAEVGRMVGDTVGKMAPLMTIFDAAKYCVLLQHGIMNDDC